MKRAVISVVAGIAGVIALWIGGVVWLNATLYAPQGQVTAYLDALEAGDMQLASALAGLDVTPAVLPASDALPANPIVTGVQPTDDNRMLVRAEYSLAGATESSVFTLERRPKLWGLFDQWAFSLPPTGTITTEVSGVDFVRVSGVDLATASARNIEVLVPASYSVKASSQWVESEEFTTVIREPASVWEVTLELRPTDALVTETLSAVEEYLGECAMRQVLQPASCPFGARVADRLYTLPEWTISAMPALSLAPTSDPATWEMVALGGEATLEATLQSLFDGSLRDYTEVVSFGLTGTVTGIDSDSPALRID